MNKAYEYAKKVVGGKLKDCHGKKTTAPKYVIKQCKTFIEVSDGKSDKYVIDERKVKKVEGLLKLLNMPLGINAGQSLYDCTTGYQWLFYIAILCTVYRDDPDRRRYETGLLEICRKNYKTYTIGTLFIILMLTEPRFSKLYSVAPDGALSREVKEAIANTLKCSPAIFTDTEGNTRWKVLRDYIECNITDVRYTPLNYTNSRFDGKLPAAFLADEVGALPNNYAIEAMRSGQLNVKNKLGCIISTKYPSVTNPFEDEVEHAKRVFDGLADDDTVFALLYEPDNPKAWASDDLVLQQANPAALEREEIWDDITKKRKLAIERESRRENFLTKHCNIAYQGAASESFISPDTVKAGEVDHIDWSGREVFVGVDLSQTNDNTSVAMACLDEDGNLLADVIAFIPEGRIEEKNKFERIRYQDFINAGKCVACGDMVIDYEVVEKFVGTLEETYGVKVMQVGYDRYNAISSAQKWEKDYHIQTVEIKQHSSVLHPATKFLSEKIEDGLFKYEKNDLLLINFQNARCTLDTNENRYVNKKKSNGKVDMVVSLINAAYLIYQDITFRSDFVCDVI
jgi:phage terminase large subunit-like protein